LLLLHGAILLFGESHPMLRHFQQDDLCAGRGHAARYLDALLCTAAVFVGPTGHNAGSAPMYSFVGNRGNAVQRFG
jgi:hypothetical protein